MTTQHNTTVANTEDCIHPETQQEHGKHQQHLQPTLRPVVNIHENDDFIALYAELPGVSQDNLEITIDKDNLLLEANGTIESPTDMKPVFAEFQTANFKRSFSLNDELDTEQVEAKLSYGILELKIPKKALARPRKVEVKVA